MPSTTIVSAFISNANTHQFHKNGDYIKNGKLFLKSTTPKIVFLDEGMFSQITEHDYDPENTKIILYGRNSVYYMKYLNYIRFLPTTDQPGKDTREFLMLMWNKTEYLREAAILNPFNTTHFVWVDFGIRYVCKNSSDQEFIDKLNRIQRPLSAPANKIRIGGIWNPEREYTVDIMAGVCWFFAGGVIGGDAETLMQFSDKMRTMCHELVMWQNRATWEVNVWYNLHKKHPELFDIYPATHNETLLDGYASDTPVTGFLNV
jgi:hypothetical protein